ncbi:MAG: enolase C-terminal domain-like protein [Pseudomonadota bacterium]
MTHIQKIEAIRVASPTWETPKWWCTSPMDGLYDLSPKRGDASMGLFNSTPDERGDNVLYVIVRIETSDGTYGYGCIGLGSESLAQLVEGILAPLIVGQNPFDVELLWEKMYRATVNIGRKGAAIIAISGIDIALWDIIGKLTKQPVYNLLGGKTRSAIRAYCSAGYPMEDPEEMAALAKSQLEAGSYTAFKMRFGYGPKDGREGMRKNKDLVRALRNSLGPNVDIMADAYMGWDETYAISMIQQLDEFELAWIEEPVLPHDLDGYARIRARVNTPISGGEHEYTRWGFRELIEKEAVDYVQPDVNRVGGITEAKKIWALAQAYNKKVVPHAHNFHNQHLIMSHMNSPLSEHFPDGFRDADTFFSELFTGEAELKDGHLYLSDKPGLGIELNEAVLKEYRISK